MSSEISDNVQQYYGGKVLTSTKDLNTTAATTTPSCKLKSKKHVKALSDIHPDVVSKYYGCGFVIPAGRVKGLNILDLGCGSGRDCFILSKLVGSDGFVTGVDMTKGQLNIANQYIDYHTNLFGYQKPNVKFVHGYIEDLKTAGIEDNSIDIIISNCVLCLCANKDAVLKEVYRVLKDGGELYFSDMYTDKEHTDDMKKNPKLWGEGLSGSLKWSTLYELAEAINFEIPRIVSSEAISILNPEIKKITGDANYAAVTFRLFKLVETSKIKGPSMEATYNGSIEDHEQQLVFDCKYTFKQGEPKAIDPHTAAILQHSRYVSSFSFANCQDNIKMEVANPFNLL